MPSVETEKGSMPSALTKNGVYVSSGMMTMHTTLRLLIIIEVQK